MLFVFQERPSDSSYVEKIWRTHSDRADSFVSLAVSHWEIVVWKHQGKTNLTVRGPETKATMAHCPEDAEFFGIQFKLGTFMPHLPAKHLVDGAVTLPAMSRTAFWLHGSAWQFPDYDTADTFVDHLVRAGLLVRDPVVDAAVQSGMHDRSLRSVQYHFARTTGLTQHTVQQIERARYAMGLLQQGVSILDTVHAAGYFDQPHLTRSLKRFIGQTPVQIARSRQPA